jgi:hypothetical protein
MGDENRTCDLCELSIEVSGFELVTQEGTRYFCCEGCKGIYHLLHEADVLPAAPSEVKDCHEK